MRPIIVFARSHSFANVPKCIISLCGYINYSRERTRAHTHATIIHLAERARHVLWHTNTHTHIRQIVIKIVKRQLTKLRNFEIRPTNQRSPTRMICVLRVRACSEKICAQRAIEIWMFAIALKWNDMETYTRVVAVFLRSGVYKSRTPRMRVMYLFKSVWRFVHTRRPSID